jgi:hypothetical protein
MFCCHGDSIDAVPMRSKLFLDCYGSFRTHNPLTLSKFCNCFLQNWKFECTNGCHLLHVIFMSRVLALVDLHRLNSADGGCTSVKALHGWRSRLAFRILRNRLYRSSVLLRVQSYWCRHYLIEGHSGSRAQGRARPYLLINNVL